MKNNTSNIIHNTSRQPRLSIIVPIYGVEQYLRKCIDSLLAQDYDDYEIILVDDGSPDSCPQICDEYVEAYPHPLPKRRGDKPTHDTFASVWGAHTADSTQYDLLKANAEKNRKNPTEAESILWDMLKGNNIGLHFRRQHIILDYIVDFICIEKGLVIELDGGYYNDPEQKEQDERRTAHLQQLGYTELRFANEELLTNPDAVIARIKEVAISLPSIKKNNDTALFPSLQGGARGRLISVIHRENGGLSAARNSGIEVACGEYIMFVDSDDYLEPNVLGALMAQIERDNLDVLRFNYQNVNEQGEIFHPFKSGKPYFDYSAGIMDGETFLNERLGYACYAWAFILRRDLIYSAQSSDIQHHTSDIAQRVLFTPGIYFEDTDWTPRMLLKAQRVASTDRTVYNYLWRQGSITLPDNPAKKKKVLEDKISLLDGFQKHQQLAQNTKWFEWQTAGTAMSILGILSTYSSSERESYIKQLKSKCIFPLSTYRANRNTKLKIWLANISPSLYCKLMNLIHK